MSTFLSPPQYTTEIAKESGTTAVAVAAISAVAAPLSLAPAVMYFRQPWYLLAFAALAALIAWNHSRKDVQARNELRPGPLHYAAAALTSICLWGMLGVTWFGFYFMFYWAFRLVGLLIVSINADACGFYTSLAFSVLAAIGIAISSARSMSRLLHTEGIHYVRGRKAFLCWVSLLLVVVAVAGGLWYLRGSDSRGAFLLLQFVPYMLGIPALSLEKSVGKKDESVEAVCKLFESAGYAVTRAPRSPDSLIDSVLSKLDLLASDDKSVFAVEIKTANDSTEPVDWSAASSLRTRVKALEYSYNEHWAGSNEEGPGLGSRRVRPLMVLVGRKPNESFVAFSSKEKMSVIELDGGIVQQVMETGDSEKLKELAHQRLQGIATTHATA